MKDETFDTVLDIAQEDLDLAVTDLTDLYNGLMKLEAYALADGDEEKALAIFDQQQGVLLAVRELILAFDDGTFAQAALGATT